MDFHYRTSYLQRHPNYICLEAIIRLHVGKRDAIEDVIIELTNQGYHFVTVSTLLELDNNSTDVMSPVYTHRSMD